MKKRTINILLIDDIKVDVQEITSQLDKTMNIPFLLTHLSELGGSIELLKKNDPKIDIVLLDLGLTCGYSPKHLFSLVESVINEIPIIVITGKEEHELALFVINAGASDNMTRGEFRGTFGILRDAIDFSMSRCSILKCSRKNEHDSEIIRKQLLSYIGGGYSYDNIETLTAA